MAYVAHFDTVVYLIYTTLMVLKKNKGIKDIILGYLDLT